MNYKNEANKYLDAKYIKTPIHSDKELREFIGVSLSELRQLWLFSSRNHFKEAVKNLIHNGVKIDFKKANKIQEVSNENRNF